MDILYLVTTSKVDKMASTFDEMMLNPSSVGSFVAEFSTFRSSVVATGAGSFTTEVEDDERGTSF